MTSKRSFCRWVFRGNELHCTGIENSQKIHTQKTQNAQRHNTRTLTQASGCEEKATKTCRNLYLNLYSSRTAQMYVCVWLWPTSVHNRAHSSSDRLFAIILQTIVIAQRIITFGHKPNLVKFSWELRLYLHHWAAATNFVTIAEYQ